MKTISDHAELVLDVARGITAGKGITHWRNDRTTWGEVLSWGEAPPEARTKEKAGSHFFGLLVPTPDLDHTRATGCPSPCHELHRNRKAVAHRTVVELDADDAPADLPERVGELGVEALVYTTAGSTPTELRLRLVFPTDRRMSPATFTAVADELMRELSRDGDPDGMWDKTCNQPSRLMYNPATREPDNWTAWHFGGALVNPDLLALDAVLERGEVATPRPAVADCDLSDPPTVEQRAKAEAVLDKALRCAGELRNSDGSQAPGRNEWAKNWLTPLLSFASGGCLDADAVMDAVWDAVSTVAGDHPFERDEYDRTCSSVLGYVQPRRPEAATAADVFGAVAVVDAPVLTSRPDLYIDAKAGLLVKRLADDVARHLTYALGSLDKRFYIYSGGVWRPEDNEIGTTVSALLGNAYRHSHLTNVEDKLRFAPGVRRIDCGPTPRWVNVRNGLLDWRSGELVEHTPDVLSTVQLPIDWDPEASCPAFEKFIRQVLPADCVEPTEGGPGFIWELLGYCAYSGNPHHVAVLLRGRGRNGKGSLLRMIEAMLGSRNVSAVSLHDLLDNRFRSADLYGRIANIAGDLDSKWMESTARFKAITGGDLISAEHKYGAAFSFTPWALPLYSVNKPFGAADSSEGWFARWVVVPFPNSFLGREDRSLDARLGQASELAGVLRRGVEALPVLMRRGRLPEPESLRAAKQAFMVSGDQVRSWLTEECELEAGSWVRRTKLWESYQGWVLDQGGGSLSRREFYNRLDQIGAMHGAMLDGYDGFRGVRLRRVD